MEPAQAWRAVSNSETMEQARRFHSPSTDWGCGLADRGGGLLFVRNVFVGERDFQILEDGQIVDQVITLENKADIRLVQFIALFDIEFVYRLIQKVVFTVQRAVEHADNAEQPGFSRPGRPHEPAAHADGAQSTGTPAAWPTTARFFRLRRPQSKMPSVTPPINMQTPIRSPRAITAYDLPPTPRTIASTISATPSSATIAMTYPLL